MKMRTFLAVTSALFGITAQVQAAGFQLAETSATGLGRAFAGEAAMADNASSQARNPAMLSYLNGTQVSTGVIYVKPDIDVTGDVTIKSSQNPTAVIPADAYDVAGSANIPNFYFSHQLNDKWAIGLALNSNYGLATQTPETHNAAAFGNKTSITTIEFNPNIAYQINDAFTLGFGARVVHGEGEISGSAPAWTGLPAGTSLKHLEGEDYGFGWKIGTSWQINPSNRIGFAYHSKVDLDLDGHASGFAYQDGIHQQFSGYIPLELPAFAELASLHQLTEGWSMQASVNWTQWSSFEELRAYFPTGVKPISPVTGKPMDSDLVKHENFKDNWRFAIGSSYQLTESVSLIGGIAYDKSAVNDQYRTTTIPDSNRLWYSLGLGYQATKQLKIDVGMTYIKSVGDALIKETVQLPPSTLASFNGEAGGDVILAGLQVNYLI